MDLVNAELCYAISHTSGEHFIKQTTEDHFKGLFHI